MNQEEARQLLQKYRLGLCSDEEKMKIETWYDQMAASGDWDWSASEKEAFNRKLSDRISKAIREDGASDSFRKRVYFRKLMAAAAVLAVLLISSLYFLVVHDQHIPSPGKPSVSLANRKPADPGTDGAVLVLSGGQKIMLDSGSKSLVATDNGVQIFRKNGGIEYQRDGELSGEAYNTMITPMAKQYHFLLSDGTGVWLNAGSSVRYPVTFSGAARTVEVTGEAYFEVAPKYLASGVKMPFIVKINQGDDSGGEVEVLGTHFNINAYNNEEAVKTTLLEGKVKVTHSGSSVILAPGNQSQLSKNGQLKVQERVDTEQILAWKNGYFSFDRTSLLAAMRQLERWYDIRVVYSGGKVPDEYFSGELPRNASLAAVLNAFKLSGVVYEINGNTLTVLQKK